MKFTQKAIVCLLLANGSANAIKMRGSQSLKVHSKTGKGDYWQDTIMATMPLDNEDQNKQVLESMQQEPMVQEVQVVQKAQGANHVKTHEEQVAEEKKSSIGSSD